MGINRQPTHPDSNYRRGRKLRRRSRNRSTLSALLLMVQSISMPLLLVKYKYLNNK
jgi:hypothetical protein